MNLAQIFQKSYRRKAVNAFVQSIGSEGQTGTCGPEGTGKVNVRVSASGSTSSRWRPRSQVLSHCFRPCQQWAQLFEGYSEEPRKVAPGFHQGWAAAAESAHRVLCVFYCLISLNPHNKLTKEAFLHFKIDFHFLDQF